MTAPYSVDRLVRKEVALGVVREKQPPMEHVGLQSIAPFKDVATDDVIFGYLQNGLQEGLAPARAEDAEAELSQKDELLGGQGSASVIDWSQADRYSPSDVTRYREDVYLAQLAAGQTVTPVPLSFLGNTQADFEARLARDDARRRRRLDNRLEWLIMTGLFEGVVTYNDGKIKFTVDYLRPADQTRQTPTSGFYDSGATDFDPIGDFRDVQEIMYARYGFRPHRAITSRRQLNLWWKSDKYRANFVPVVGGVPSSSLDPYYLANFSQDAVIALTEKQTGITFEAYDSVYQTRAIGSTTRVNVRFTDDRLICFMPTTADWIASQDPTQVLPSDVGEIDDTEIGFAKTLTAPHPEGLWQSGFYEWEQNTVNPWGHVRGTGIKAFPVFPYLEMTYTLQATSA